MIDDEKTPYSFAEREAESVALICCESLNPPGAEFSRGYIQAWVARGSINQTLENSSYKIFSAANKILKAGQGKK